MTSDLQTSFLQRNRGMVVEIDLPELGIHEIVAKGLEYLNVPFPLVPR